MLRLYQQAEPSPAALLWAALVNAQLARDAAAIAADDGER
jgi:hypothetical protein